MKILVLILSLFVVAGALAQENREILRITGFTGLNTADGDFVIKPNEARVSVNVDYSRNGAGNIAKRKGYEVVDTCDVGNGKIIGMFPAYYSDGTQQLFVTVKDDSGFASIWRSNKGSVNLSTDSLTEVWHYWGDDNTTTRTMYDDMVFSFNGSHKGFMYDKYGSHEYPVRAPGEPTIIPLSVDTSIVDTLTYKISGEYYYGIAIRGNDADTGNTLSYMCGPVTVDNGRALLTNWVYLKIMQFADIADSSLDVYITDTNIVKIYRTRANPGRITTETQAFFTGDSIIWAVGVGPVPVDTAALRAVARTVFVDSIPDANLTTDSISLMDIRNLTHEWENDFHVTYADPIRYGSPIFRDTLKVMDTAMRVGDFWPGQIEGWQYNCTYFDTSTGWESDTGRGFFIPDPIGGRYSGFNDTLYGLRVMLPYLHHSDYFPNLVINLYRTPHITRLDSVGHPTPVPQKLFDCNGDGKITESDIDCYMALKPTTTWTYQHRGTEPWGTFYIGRGAPGATITDTFSCSQLMQSDSVIGTAVFMSAPPPPGLTNTMTHNNMIFGVNKSRVYNSNLDRLDKWGVFDFVRISENDGDEITGIASSRTALRVYKNYSNYNLYDDFSQPERVGGWGCIAPKSLQSTPQGIIYLSEQGVVVENEGQSLERTVVQGLVSQKLNNFSELSLASRRTAVGRYLQSEQQYWLSIGDSTYVLDFLAGARMKEPVWTVYNFGFDEGFLYDTETDVDFIPGQTFYFFENNDSVLYKFGDVEYDIKSNEGIDFRWTSPPLFYDPQKTEIYVFGLGGHADSAATQFTLYALDETGVGLGSKGIDSLTQYYRAYEMEIKPSLYYSIYLLAIPGVTDLNGETYISLIDIYHRKNAERYLLR